MKNSYPKISIVTPNFNTGEFLEETILSIITQNYPNLEYIIIDGGSTDNSIEIIKKYEKDISYWISEKDSGMYEAIQKGFEIATGDIMAWLNADDKYYPRSLFIIANIFIYNPEIEWLTGYNTFYNEFGETFHIQPSFEHNRYSQFIHPKKYIQQESTFWRKSLWEKAGSYIDKNLKYAGDFELWLRFNRFEQIYFVDTILGGFRIHSNQLTQNFMNLYEQEITKCLHNELTNHFGFYNKCILSEIKYLTKKLISLKDVNKIKRIKNTIKKLTNQKDTLYYDLKTNTYKKKEKTMNSLLSTITTRRESKKDFLELLKYQHQYYPEIILDVGVANGTFEIYETFPQSHIILFEPLVEFEPSMNYIQKKYSNVSLEICALGKENTTIDINVHPDLVGSSLYLENEDSNVNGKKRFIPMFTLNNFINKYNLNTKSILLKIDVQGAEKDVLDGATDIFKNIDIIILEVSLFNFFNNNLSFFDIISYMKKYDYIVYDFFDFIYRPIDGALAQIDIAFVKENSPFREKQIFATKEQREKLNNEFNQIKETSTSKNLSFSKQFNKLYEYTESFKNSYDSYIIYGNGTIGKTIQKLIPEKIIGYVDINDKDNHPENLVNLDFDKIIITVLGREKEITQYLTDKLKIDKDKIIILEL